MERLGICGRDTEGTIHFRRSRRNIEITGGYEGQIDISEESMRISIHPSGIMKVIGIILGIIAPFTLGVSLYGVWKLLVSTPKEMIANLVYKIASRLERSPRKYPDLSIHLTPEVVISGSSDFFDSMPGTGIRELPDRAPGEIIAQPKGNLCLQCQNLGEDQQSCIKEYLFLADKGACTGFKPVGAL